MQMKRNLDMNNNKTPDDVDVIDKKLEETNDPIEREQIIEREIS